jgi:L-lysine exporter family protein LysE/ArgO
MSTAIIGTPFLAAFQTGLFTSAGLIIAIGNQNAFVLSQGLRRQHGTAIAALCATIDLVLIIAGVLGMGVIIQQHPLMMQIALWGGALFLGGYGLKALLSAFSPEVLNPETGTVMTLKTALLTTFAVSLLNPHVYLDTVILLGSIGGQFDQRGQLGFIAGAVSASVTWFFSLALGARVLTPLFKKPVAWRVLDLVVCGFMWSVAATLIRQGLEKFGGV